MTRTIRVLVVDDAVAVRRTVSESLARDPDIKVAATAANGRIALAKLDRVRPDVVILDVEMPEMDGLKTLVRLRESHPGLPVIMFSSYTEPGAAATLDALSLGATDYVTKPSTLRLGDGVKPFHEELRQKVKGVTAHLFSPAVVPVEQVPALNRSRSSDFRKPRIVAIGASTGGPNALSTVLASLPEDLPVPIVIVQHMPTLFTRLLARRLDAVCRLQVREAVAGGEVVAGRVWIARGDWHMTIDRKEAVVRIRNHRAQPENSCRPSVDVMLRSVAKVYGGDSLAVVLTGMGKDGLSGCEAIRRQGGEVLVQDQGSSVVWGMPGFVAQSGLANSVVPIGDMGSEIVRRVVGSVEPEAIVEDGQLHLNGRSA